jgi:hypothetical protein
MNINQTIQKNIETINAIKSRTEKINTAIEIFIFRGKNACFEYCKNNGIDYKYIYKYIYS